MRKRLIRCMGVARGHNNRWRTHLMKRLLQKKTYARYCLQVVVSATAFLCLGGVSQAAPVGAGSAGEQVVTGAPNRYGGPSQFRPSLNIPSAKTSISFGGFAKFDSWYDRDFDQGGSPNPFTLFLRDETDGRFGMTFFESRMNFRSTSDTNIGKIDTVFEFDFWPDGELNLRHAYGQVGNFVIGQTWSNAWSPIGEMRILKYGGMSGATFGTRQTQVRYTIPMGQNSFSVSLEDPAGVADAIVGTTGTPEHAMPDLTARFQMGRSLIVSGIARRIETREGVGISKMSTTGYAGIVQGQYPILPATALKFTFWAGKGVASYIPGGSTAGPASLRDAYVDNDSLTAVGLAAGQLGFEQRWNQEWSSNFAYSRVEQDDIPVGDLAERHELFLANLWWDPVPRFSLGVEYTFAKTTRQGGDERDASRLQTSAIFQF